MSVDEARVNPADKAVGDFRPFCSRCGRHDSAGPLETCPVCGRGVLGYHADRACEHEVDGVTLRQAMESPQAQSIVDRVLGPVIESPYGNRDVRFDNLADLYALADTGNNADDITLVTLANDLSALGNLDTTPLVHARRLDAFRDLVRAEVDARLHYDRMHP